MKNKHPNAIAVLALGLAMAGLHLADLLLWSDAETGFATAGSVWLRYIPWLAALALPYLPARPTIFRISSFALSFTGASVKKTSLHMLQQIIDG